MNVPPVSNDIPGLSSWIEKQHTMKSEDVKNPFEDQYAYIMSFMSERFQALQLHLDRLHEMQDEILHEQ